MARVLLAWELGAGFGHVRPLLQIAARQPADANVQCGGQHIVRIVLRIDVVLADQMADFVQQDGQ